jgi:hypothetical protein
VVVLKRIIAWSCETAAEAVLLGGLLVILSGTGRHGLVKDLEFAIIATLFVFMLGSGYLVTTALVGVVWRSKRVWLYPAIAAVLFIVHLQFSATGWTSSEKLPIQGAGACIVFACTLAGNYLLRKCSIVAV